MRNALQGSESARALDATDCIDYLMKCKDGGLHVKFETDAEGRLSRVFLEMPGAALKFAQGNCAQGEEMTHLILYDTTVRTLILLYMPPYLY